MRIAVVGAGISGLGAAWLLSRRHEVHVFERDARIGGHTNTVVVDQGAGSTLPVDTGFIVYNEATYPLFTRLLDELGVTSQPSDMSWSLRCERCDLEYAGSGPGLFAQPRRVADPGHLTMIADILRFHRVGRRLLEDPGARGLTVGGFLRDGGFGHGLRAHYLLPMTAAIWSSGTEVVERFPLQTLLRFLHNHGLLGVTTHHPWRTVAGGSSTYLAPLTTPFADRVHRGDPVIGVARDHDGVRLRLRSGAQHRVDAVVIATHADEALGVLEDPSPREKELLGPWEASSNDTWLHTDTRLLPRSPRAWASWNHLLADCRAPSPTVSLTYRMNRLQRLDTPVEHLVTLNPPVAPRPDRVVRRMTYTHPVFTHESVGTQAALDELNGQRRTFFVGAYQRYGFHEDGLWSAVRAASHLGVRWPR